MDEYYRILGLSPGATVADIKKAYRLLALKYHPDVNPSQEANLRFQQIADAHEQLLAHHQSSIAQAYAHASSHYQAQYQQFYQTSPPHTQHTTYRSTTATSNPPTGTVVDQELTPLHRVVYFILDLLSWSVSLFFISLPIFAGYLMAEKGFSWWEGAIMTPLSLAGILVIWRTIRYRKNAF